MVGRAEEFRLAPGHPFEQLLGDVELDLEAKRRYARQVRMGEGVVADDVSLGELAAHQIGTRLRVLADEEESGVHAARLEQVEDARRPDGIGPVVEGDGDAARGLSALAL